MNQKELKPGMSPFDVNDADCHLIVINADGSGLPADVVKKFPSLAKVVKTFAGAGKLKPGDCAMWKAGSLWWALPIARASAKEVGNFQIVRQAIETAAVKIFRQFAMVEVVVWVPEDLCKLEKGYDDWELALTTIDDHVDKDFVLWTPRDPRITD